MNSQSEKSTSDCQYRNQCPLRIAEIQQDIRQKVFCPFSRYGFCFELFVFCFGRRNWHLNNAKVFQLNGISKSCFRLFWVIFAFEQHFSNKRRYNEFHVFCGIPVIIRSKFNTKNIFEIQALHEPFHIFFAKFHELIYCAIFEFLLLFAFAKIIWHWKWGVPPSVFNRINPTRHMVRYGFERNSVNKKFPKYVTNHVFVNRSEFRDRLGVFIVFIMYFVYGDPTPSRIPILETRLHRWHFVFFSEDLELDPPISFYVAIIWIYWNNANDVRPVVCFGEIWWKIFRYAKQFTAFFGQFGCIIFQSEVSIYLSYHPTAIFRVIIQMVFCVFQPIK